MAKKTMNVKWELDVPAMVAKLGEEKARQLWEQSKKKKTITGRGFKVIAPPGKFDNPNKPLKLRKLKGVTKVEIDEGGKVDKNQLMPEIVPFLKIETREVGMEEAEEAIDEKETDKDIEEIDKAIESYRKEEGE